jgi:hypothetical protein
MDVRKFIVCSACRVGKSRIDLSDGFTAWLTGWQEEITSPWAQLLDEGDIGVNRNSVQSTGDVRGNRYASSSQATPALGQSAPQFGSASF